MSKDTSSLKHPSVRPTSLVGLFQVLASYETYNSGRRWLCARAHALLPICRPEIMMIRTPKVGYYSRNQVLVRARSSATWWCLYVLYLSIRTYEYVQVLYTLWMVVYLSCEGSLTFLFYSKLFCAVAVLLLVNLAFLNISMVDTNYQWAGFCQPCQYLHEGTLLSKTLDWS